MAYWLTKKSILTVSNELRSNGNKIIFTHGAFDLFHPGHSYHLNESKKNGDILIVGVDSDDRVKRYKNIARPIIPMEGRAEVLRDMKQIDFLFSINDLPANDEEFFFDLYKRLNPNLVTFGRKFAFRNQFTKNTTINFLETKKIFSPNYSTTNIIQKIRRS